MKNNLNNLLDDLQGVINNANTVIESNCFYEDNLNVVEGLELIKHKIQNVYNEVKSIEIIKGDKGDKGEPGEKGEPGSASLAIDDERITPASAWSSSRMNKLNYQHEQEIVTDRAFSFDSNNGYIEILSIRGHSMIIGGVMTSVTNGKGLEITTYNGFREDTKQLLYYDDTENNWKKIKQLNGNDDCFDSVEYDVNKGTYKYVKRCRLEGNNIIPLDKELVYKANMLNLNSYEPSTSLKINSTLFPTIRFHLHTKLHDNVLKNKERLSNLETGLQKLSGRGSIISDDEISKRKTWSSYKISSLITGKPIPTPPVNYVVKTSDKHIPNTGEGLFKDFLIDGRTLVNTIPKNSQTLKSNGSGIGTTNGKMVTPKLKLPEHSEVTLLVRCTKDSEDIAAKIGGTYVHEITLEPGLRTYVTNVNMSNGVLQPYISNNAVSDDSVKIDILNLVEGNITDLTEFEGMKSVGFDKGLYLESIKSDGNIFNSYLKLANINPTSGDEVESSSSLVSAFIYVKPGVKYSWSLFDEITGKIYEYDDRKNFIKKSHIIQAKDNAVFTGNYIKVQFDSTNKKLLFMLNEGIVKEYEVPVFNRTHVMYKDNGIWKPVTELKGVNGVQDSIVKHPDNKYYLHMRTQKLRSTDLVNPQKKEEIVDRDIWYFDITSERLGETIGDTSNLLVQCDKLTPMPVNKFTSIEQDLTYVIGYAPVVKKIYIALPKGQESDIMAYLKRVNFEFIFPCDEVIYEVNPIYLRSYYPATNISLRGSVIVPQYEFNNDTNLQSIAKENLIRLQQIESEMFKSNGGQINVVDGLIPLDDRLSKIENMVQDLDVTKSSLTNEIVFNSKNGNIKISKIYGNTVNNKSLQSVGNGSMVNIISKGNGLNDNKKIMYKDNDQWKLLKELRGLDTVCDTIEMHNDGKYYYHKRTVKGVLDGTHFIKSITQLNNTNKVHLDIKTYKVITNNGGSLNLICDKLPTMQGNEDVSHIRTDGSSPYANLILWLDKSYGDSQDIINQNLSNRPITFIAELAEEEVFEVNPLMLTSYENETTVSINSDVNPKYFEIKTSGNIVNYVKNNETRIKWLEDNFRVYNAQFLI